MATLTQAQQRALTNINVTNGLQGKTKKQQIRILQAVIKQGTKTVRKLFVPKYTTGKSYYYYTSNSKGIVNSAKLFLTMLQNGQ